MLSLRAHEQFFFYVVVLFTERICLEVVTSEIWVSDCGVYEECLLLERDIV